MTRRWSALAAALALHAVRLAEVALADGDRRRARRWLRVSRAALRRAERWSGSRRSRPTSETSETSETGSTP